MINDRYIRIYDINIKVSQKLAGHMALNVDTLAKAKKLFEVETDSLAGFACMAGMVNSNINAEEWQSSSMN